MNARFKTPLVKNAMIILLLSSAVALPALAADPGAAAKGATQNAAADTSNVPTMMQTMKTQMAAIKAEKDPAKRTQLMNEHMTSMQAAMQAMQNDGGCTMMNGNMMSNGMMQGMSGSGGMSMMQMMMEQMEEHQKAMQGAAK
jgi:hypothetical protein